MDLSLLPLLDALLQEGSVTRAAARVGLSTPAASHALARIREQLQDELLVRAGRTMVLTPRAVELRGKVHELVSEAASVLAPEARFEPALLERSFHLRATDHFLGVLGTELDRAVQREAPKATLRFSPNTTDDVTPLRTGEVDVAIGIYGELPPELRTRLLFTDRFVSVLRAGHPAARRLTLERFVALEHVQIAPRARPGGMLDALLADLGHSRRIARAVPYFLAGLLLVAETDYVMTLSERLARGLASKLGLEVVETPVEIPPYALSMIWHPRNDRDAAHRWLRERLVESARRAAPEVHPGARRRLSKRKRRARL